MKNAQEPIGATSTILDPVELDLGSLEDGALLRRHLLKERSLNLNHAFKKALCCYRCSVCEFDFESVYGEMGKQIIEAHHVVSASPSALEQETHLSEMTAVCSNCHRMLHRQKDPAALEILAESFGSQCGVRDDIEENHAASIFSTKYISALGIDYYLGQPETLIDKIDYGVQEVTRDIRNRWRLETLLKMPGWRHNNVGAWSAAALRSEVFIRPIVDAYCREHANHSLVNRSFSFALLAIGTYAAKEGLIQMIEHSGKGGSMESALKVIEESRNSKEYDTLSRARDRWREIDPAQLDFSMIG